MKALCGKRFDGLVVRLLGVGEHEGEELIGRYFHELGCYSEIAPKGTVVHAFKIKRKWWRVAEVLPNDPNIPRAPSRYW